MLPSPKLKTLLIGQAKGIAMQMADSLSFFGEHGNCALSDFPLARPGMTPVLSSTRQLDASRLYAGPKAAGIDVQKSGPTA